MLRMAFRQNEAAPLPPSDAVPPPRPLDARACIADRLRTLGHPTDILTDDAVDDVMAYASGSITRLRAVLASALFLASTEDAPRIDRSHIVRAIQSLPPDDVLRANAATRLSPSRTLRSWRDARFVVGSALAAMLVIAVAWWLQPSRAVPPPLLPAVAVPQTAAPAATPPVPASYATVPGASVPGAPVPGAPVPHAPAPYAPVPHAPVPDVPVSGAQVSDVPAPHAPAPATPGSAVIVPAMPAPAVTAAATKTTPASKTPDQPPQPAAIAAVVPQAGPPQPAPPKIADIAVEQPAPQAPPPPAQVTPPPPITNTIAIGNLPLPPNAKPLVLHEPPPPVPHWSPATTTIVLRFQPDDPQSVDKLIYLTQRLRRAGFSRIYSYPLGIPVRRSAINYFYAQDRPAAVAVISALGLNSPFHEALHTPGHALRLIASQADRTPRPPGTIEAIIP